MKGLIYRELITMKKTLIICAVIYIITMIGVAVVFPAFEIGNLADLADEDTYAKVADSVMMNVMAEFDGLVHNAVTAMNGILHGLPDSFQVVDQRGILNAVDELRQADALFPAQLQDLGEMLLRIDLAVLVGLLALDADRAAADAEDAVRADHLAALERLKEHGVRVGQLALAHLAVEDDLRAGQARFDRAAGAVALAGEGERAEERHAEGVGLRIALAELRGRAVGADGVGARRTVADLINTLYALHMNPPLGQKAGRTCRPFLIGWVMLLVLVPSCR